MPISKPARLSVHTHKGISKESTHDGENPACLNFLTCGKGVKCFLHPGHWELNANRLWDLILTPVGTKSQSMQSTLCVQPYLRYGIAVKTLATSNRTTITGHIHLNANSELF